MDGHLVTVEVGVEAGAYQRMQLDGAAINHYWFKRLNTHAMQRRRAIQHHDPALDHIVEDFPDFFIATFELALGGLHRLCVTTLFQSTNDERLK